MYSATLHSFEVKKLAEALMHFPTWVDLKGQDSVPDTVHHVVLNCNPRVDSAWANVRNPTPTDRVHERDRVGPGVDSPGKLFILFLRSLLQCYREILNTSTHYYTVVYCGYYTVVACSKEL